MEFENIRAALRYLLEINNRHINKQDFVIEGGADGVHTRKETYADLQDLNADVLANICDLLGMSNLYLHAPINFKYHGKLTDEEAERVKAITGCKMDPSAGDEQEFTKLDQIKGMLTESQALLDAKDLDDVKDNLKWSLELIEDMQKGN